MKKKIVIFTVMIIIGIIIVSFSPNGTNEKNNIVFHITLADPNQYQDGIFTDKFVLEKGEYVFRFVPNGSSPEILSISLNSNVLDLVEVFHLEGTSHKTEISEYFTWKYKGEKSFLISEKQEIVIVINPNGNVMGSVSVDILEN